jgi:hypothetical protein
MASGLFNLKQVNQAISQGAWSGYIAPRWVEYLTVAGGGGGGRSQGVAGGGGGAGGLLTGIVTVATGASYTVTVGGGGNGGTSGVLGTVGGNSGFSTITATGGGYGGQNTVGSAGVGGSGGGGCSYGTAYIIGAAGTSGQGNAGGNGVSLDPQCSGGGGGAGTIGLTGFIPSNAGNGGAGIASAVTGTVTVYAGGGGGGSENVGVAGVGGVGGGGAGGVGAGTAGATNTGGGGGGSAYNGGEFNGAAGGSGIVVVRYPGNVQFYTGGTLSYANGYIIHTFFANGTLAPTTPTPYVTDYQISRSLRFNSADSAYLSRTLTTPTNNTVWSFSFWLKRSTLATQQYFLNVNSYCGIGTNSDSIVFWNNAGTTLATSTAVFRDVSAWYHVVVVSNGTTITAYVNNSSVLTYTGTITNLNSAVVHNIGRDQTSNSAYLNGYMTEVNFIDGSAALPSSFGYTNPATGIWSPAKYVGGYGTNGFYVNFSDNSNTTAATLGADYSGNGNNWTPNNFSVTAGAGNDSMVDSPTSYGTDTGVGGTVRGNYATLNRLNAFGTSTFTNGNLDVSVSSLNTNNLATIAIPTSGKWYWEYQITAIGGGGSPMGGIASSSSNSPAIFYRSNGDKLVDGASSSYGATYTTTDIIGVAVDTDGGTITFYKNGSSQGAVTYATSSGNFFPALRSNAATDNFTLNFGQRAFANTAPSGFKALCTQNLPTPTIGATTATTADKFFAPVLYTGTGTTNNITVGFQPDFLWFKTRSNIVSHALYNSISGVTKFLTSNSTAAEATSTANTDLISINPTGFTVGTPDHQRTNDSGRTYVAWNWRAGGTAVSNTSGSITSSVSANTTAGFSVVTYTNASSGTVGHGLGVAPAMVIYKDRTNVTNWIVLHQSLANMSSSFLVLNLTNAVATLGTALGGNPTSSVIYTNTDIIQNGAASVAYCFAEIAGYSKFGSYTGNGSADGPFVYLGFRPAFWIMKRTDTTGEWFCFDSARDTANPESNYLKPYDSAAEASFASLDFLSNGFKIRQSGFSTNGGTFIYMCFASNPFKYSLAR